MQFSGISKVPVILLVNLLLLITWSCTDNSRKAKESSRDYLKEGAEVAALAQRTLVTNLTQAIESGGATYAIGFCNTRADELMDSLSESFSCSVSRITDRNRNPENSIQSDLDTTIWQFYKSTGSSSDTFLVSGESGFFFRPIKIALPLCLNCHGEPGLEIEKETLAIIDSLYPLDLARNYKTGDLRGLFKVEFTETEN
jgi:hypothetical protein